MPVNFKMADKASRFQGNAPRDRTKLCTFCIASGRSEDNPDFEVRLECLSISCQSLPNFGNEKSWLMWSVFPGLTRGGASGTLCVRRAGFWARLEWHNVERTRCKQGSVYTVARSHFPGSSQAQPRDRQLSLALNPSRYIHPNSGRMLFPPGRRIPGR